MDVRESGRCDNTVTEPVTDGHGLTLDLPVGMLELESLQDVLSIHTWRNVLDESEREVLLRQFLPPGTTDEHVQELLSPESNLFFGSPVTRLWDAARAGRLHPRVVRYLRAIDVLHRAAHVHRVRDHHNKLVNRMCEARDARAAILPPVIALQAGRGPGKKRQRP